MASLELPTGLVGTTMGPSVQEVDARWLMAYAAALGETGAGYFDTRRRAGVDAHPLFPVCYEWPVAVALRAALPEAISVRSVHATHDLRIHRPPRAGDRLSVRATVTRLEPRRAGAYVLSRYETTDAAGEPVTTTEYGSVYLGVRGPGADGTAGVASGPVFAAPAGASAPHPSASGAAPSGGGATHAWTESVPVAAGLAHVYTECARIWNPIHTDAAVAERAGLPEIILHGTATLALAISRVLAHEGREPGAVTRVVGRFGAMVAMPSALSIRGHAPEDTPEGRRVRFDALAAGGGPAIRDGALWLA
jgi:acyl dehydratase